MTIFDLVKLAGSNLWRRRMRTALTVLGVVIGTACIIVMITLGISGLEQTMESFGGMGMEVIDVYAGGGDMYGGGMAISPAGGGGSSDSSSVIDDAAIERFKSISGVKAVSPIISLTVTARVGKYRGEIYSLYAMDSSAMGNIKLERGNHIDPASPEPQLLLTTDTLMNFNEPGQWVDYYAEFSDYDMYTGKMKSEEERAELRTRLPGPDVDWMNTRLQLTLGWDYSEEESMFPGEGESNNDIPKSKKYSATVAGIIDRDSGSWYSYMDLEVAKRMLKENRKLAESQGMSLKEGEYSQARIIANDADDVESIIAQVRAMGYQPDNNLEWIKEYQDTVRRQQSQLLLIAAISLLVSAIGIANTMLTTIMERRSEIGVMKVVGMKIRSINFLFLTEATIIGLVGGLAGTILSYILVFALNNSGAASADGSLFGIYLGENVQLGIPIWLIAVAVGIAMLTGLISGLYPSWKATKMSPLEAIRST